MTSRILPPSEWPSLAGTLLEQAWPTFDPQTARVLVMEQDGEIVAAAALFPIWHFEGAWIREDMRYRISLGRRFIAAARRLVDMVGASEIWMMATSDVGRHICESLGPFTRMDCDHYAVQIRGTNGVR